MEITEIRVFIKEGQDKKLKAYTTVTFDHVFVVRNIKVIQGASGLFIAMPSRKLKSPCPKCSFKNEVGSKFCNQCGASLPPQDKPVSAIDMDTKSEHRDIAHPVTQQFREYLQNKVIEAYKKEAENQNPSGVSQEVAL
ncbi:MAG TPA: septation protein SpoVG family protein [Candidatus Omnitrophota bacterium]|nr:septation protein SpoVG family protein [Candidatus Omnitrophota bacterium]